MAQSITESVTCVSTNGGITLSDQDIDTWHDDTAPKQTPADVTNDNDPSPSCPTWQHPADSSHDGMAQQHSTDSSRAVSIIVDSKDTSSWPCIGDNEELCNSSLGSHSSMMAMSTASGSMSSTTIDNGAPSNSMADNATSKQSVILSSSANHMDRLDSEGQSSPNDKKWFDSSSSPNPSAWDGNQPGNNMQSQSQSLAGNSSNQFPSSGSSWNQPTFSGSGDASTSRWGGPLSNNTSPWPSQPSQQQPTPQSSSSDGWGPPCTAAPAKWGTGGETWDQSKQTTTAGTDGWSTSAAASQQQQQSSPDTLPPPSTTGAALSSSSWGAPSSLSTTSVSSQSHTQNALAQQPSTSTGTPWSSMPASTTGQSSQSSSPTKSGWAGTDSSSAVTSPTMTGDTTCTTWAGAAAKGLPKAPPKPPEPVDPVRQQKDNLINSTEGWGKIPVRQDTAWGRAPEKKKQDDSNTWNATPNNGTAIWEASKSSNGTPANWDALDKNNWNDKVIANDDPNVWRPGSKGKDNAMWDTPNAKEPEPPAANQWSSSNAMPPGGMPPQTGTLSQASSGDGSGSDGGWSSNRRPSPPNTSNPNIPQSTSISEPNSSNSPTEASWSADAKSTQPSSSSQGWGAPTGRRPGDTTPSEPSGGGYWNDSQSQPQGNKPSGWGSQPQTPSSASGGNNWPDNQSSGQQAGGNNSNWGAPPPGGRSNPNWSGEGQSGNQWNSSRPSGNKPGWDDNGDQSDYNSGNMPRRQFKSESDAPQNWDDADMGDWNESNSVWSSAGGFKQRQMLSQKPSTIPENSVMQSNKPGGHYGGGSGGGQSQLTRSQMIQTLIGMGFQKEEALNALLRNDMNLQSAISELISNSGSGHMPGGHHQPGPHHDKPYNSQPHPGAMGMPGNGGGPGISHQTSSPLNTLYNNPAQNAKPSANTAVLPGSSRMKPNQPPNAIGPRGSNSVQQHQQQRLIVQQLQLGVRMGNIIPQILNLPLSDQTLRSIQQLLNLQTNYQHHQDQLMTAQRRPPNMSNPQAIDNLKQQLAMIQQQMMKIQQHIMNQQQQMPKVPSEGNLLGDQLSGMSVGGGAAGGTSFSQSRLPQWQKANEGEKHDRAPGGRNTAANLHSSHSTPNLQAGMIGDNSPWSTGATSSASSGWSTATSQFLDSGSNLESHGGGNSSSQPQSSFDIPEFVPGQPWQGANPTKVEDDPNITPGSVARSLSVSTLPPNYTSAQGRSSDLGWGPGRGNPGRSWPNNAPGSPGTDMWNKGTRPPPGFNKNINRSISMPHGSASAGDKSAFSPVSASWDNQGQMSNAWLVLRNLTPQIDGATLKTLCMQHGPLLNFFVNQSNGQALVKYSSLQEGVKAQKSLNSCVLGNTTIMAEFADENEVQQIIDQSQRQGNISRPASSMSGLWSGNNSSAPSNSLWPGSTSAGSSSTGSPWGPSSSSSLLDNGMNNGGLLPVDLLGTNDFSM